MKKSTATLSPMKARTLNAVCKLQRDNKSYGDFWIMLDGTTVWIGRQKGKAPSDQAVAIPRAQFNKMVSWYLRPQRIHTAV